jgi:hypothetical protein
MDVSTEIDASPDWDPIGGPIVPGDFPPHPDAVPLSATAPAPSATALRASELLCEIEREIVSEMKLTRCFYDVRDFLRDLSREAT